MSKIELQKEYRVARDTPSDINEHLELLKLLADQVSHVTEMGVRDGNSTRAFLSTNVSLRSYDLFLNERVSELFSLAQDIGKDVKYIQYDVLTLEIEPTDFLFIDTWHCYDQLSEELKLHAPKVRKYIAFHDTQSYGTTSEIFMDKCGSNGLLPAIIHFMIKNSDEWKFKIHRTNNNGLTVIERRNPLDLFSESSYNT